MENKLVAALPVSTAELGESIKASGRAAMHGAWEK
jgi:hypothetical protein